MIISINRIKSSSNSTLGTLFIDGKYQFFTLEDEPRDKKIKGKTRIPSGLYPLELRYAGGMYEKYSKRFREDHPILWIRKVPNFQYVYFHIGNTHENTEGCVLIGTDFKEETSQEGLKTYSVWNSTGAYRKFYFKVRDKIKNGNFVQVLICDIDRIMNA